MNSQVKVHPDEVGTEVKVAATRNRAPFISAQPFLFNKVALSSQADICWLWLLLRYRSKWKSQILWLNLICWHLHKKQLTACQSMLNLKETTLIYVCVFLQMLPFVRVRSFCVQEHHTLLARLGIFITDRKREFKSNTVIPTSTHRLLHTFQHTDTLISFLPSAFQSSGGSRPAFSHPHTLKPRSVRIAPLLHISTAPCPWLEAHACCVRYEVISGDYLESVTQDMRVPLSSVWNPFLPGPLPASCR